jgi:MATE family multidrug resistance protein
MYEFIQYRSYGFFFYSFTLVLNSFWAGIAQTRVMVYTTIITAAVTILLDYGLVFGNLGMPNMGISGAALATTIAEACAFFFLLFFTLKYHDRFHTSNLDSKNSQNTNSYDLKKWLLKLPTDKSIALIKLGGPIALQMVSSLGIWVIFYEFVESMGEQQLQSSFIVRNMYMLAYVSVGGFSTTAKTYVSGLIAENRQSELHRTMKKLMLMNFVGIFLLSHGLWLYPEWIAKTFTTDLIVIEQTIATMHIVLPAMLIFSVTSILLSTVEGSGNTVAGFIVEIVTVMFYILSAYYMVYVWKWPIHLVWTADYIYFVCLGILSMAFLWNGKWKMKKI